MKEWFNRIPEEAKIGLTLMLAGVVILSLLNGPVVILVFLTMIGFMGVMFGLVICVFAIAKKLFQL